MTGELGRPYGHPVVTDDLDLPFQLELQRRKLVLVRLVRLKILGRLHLQVHDFANLILATLLQALGYLLPVSAPLNFLAEVLDRQLPPDCIFLE